MADKVVDIQNKARALTLEQLNFSQFPNCVQVAPTEFAFEQIVSADGKDIPIAVVAKLVVKNFKKTDKADVFNAYEQADIFIAEQERKAKEKAEAEEKKQRKIEKDKELRAKNNPEVTQE